MMKRILFAVTALALLAGADACVASFKLVANAAPPSRAKLGKAPSPPSHCRWDDPQGCGILD